MEPMKPMKPLSMPPAVWWPDDLSSPSSTGSQGKMRYAFFPAQRRLVVDLDGRVTQYDTGDHLINGVSQRADSDGGGIPSFTSQHGEVDVARLQQIRS